MAIDKIMSKKVFLQDDDKVPGAYVNTTRRFPPSFSHKNDTFNLTKYIKDIVATVSYWRFCCVCIYYSINC
jgi:hypothetical protein